MSASENVRCVHKITDDDGDVVGEVWRIGRTLSSRYYRSVAMVYDIDTEEYNQPKHLANHTTVAEAEGNIRKYWGME